MGHHTFPRQARLLKPAEFKGVFDNPPMRFSAGEVLLLARPRSEGASRLGIVAPKKASKLATQRNRFKRQVREFYRSHRHELPGLDIVVLARRGVDDLDNSRIRERLDTLWNRLLKRAASVQQQASP